MHAVTPQGPPARTKESAADAVHPSAGVAWPSAVRSLVADLLNADVYDVTKLTARVADAIANVELSSAGKVSRHVVRGPPLWDPRAAKLAEDVACPAGMRDPAELLTSWPRL